MRFRNSLFRDLSQGNSENHLNFKKIKVSIHLIFLINFQVNQKVLRIHVVCTLCLLLTTPHGTNQVEGHPQG